MNAICPEDKLEPIHPGEILDEEFLKPLAISRYRLAKDMDVPRARINEIVHGKRGITADTALRLAKFFGTTAEFWMNLQDRWNCARRARGAVERGSQVQALPCDHAPKAASTGPPSPVRRTRKRPARPGAARASTRAPRS